MRALAKTALIQASILAASIFGAARADAAQCNDLDGNGVVDPTPILWIENGDTQEPLMKRIGKLLLHSQTPIRIVYRNRPTCELAQNFFTTRTLAPVASRALRAIPDDPAFDPQKDDALICEEPAAAAPVELAIGATYLSSCPTLAAPPADTAVVNGPNQAYGFIVPKASGQVAITAEEGYLAFGFADANGQASPWTVQNLRFIRGTTASTTLTIASNISLTAGQMRAVQQTTSIALRNAVRDAADVQAAIGILGTELYDQDRSGVKLIAFKGFKQKYAYYPDATSTSFDKQNVRDGHYLPWSPTPYIFEKNAGGDPVNPDVARIMGLLFGTRLEADVPGLQQVVDSGLVPQCAMKVQRDRDGGGLALFSPPEPCGCFFEEHVPQGTTSCTTCKDDGPCGGGKCRFGYCEAR